MRKVRDRSSGFTFVETLLAVILVGVLAGVAAKVLISGLDVYSLVANRNSAFHSAREAMDRMVGEILVVESSDITSINDTSFGFRDRDGASTDFRRATLTMGGRSVPCIFRGDDFLAGDVESLNFSYFQEDGTPTDTPALVRRIHIDLIIMAAGTAGRVHLRTNIVPRNFVYSGFE
jgi:type II secretory pathway pseudopilin PulG